MPVATTNDDGITFAEWLRRVDAIISARVGVTSSDMEDFRSYDAWDACQSPREGADECMENDEVYQMWFDYNDDAAD